MGMSAVDLLAECKLYRQGCQTSWFKPSEPGHSVYLSPFYLDVYEVTNEAYVQFLNAIGTHVESCQEHDCLYLEEGVVRLAAGQYNVPTFLANHPVSGVTWYGAVAYCEWRGARLPTEAEWELSASWNPEQREKNRYPWGNTFSGENANSCDRKCLFPQAVQDFDDGYPRTSPVGHYPDGQSPIGIYDMAGNLWEWTADWYDPDYYVESPIVNPRGPDEGEQYVVRGGSWFDTGNFTASVFRTGYDPTETDDTIGFRCARDG